MTNHNDLIERWQNIKCGPKGYCSEPIADLISETISALTPMLPSHVDKMVKKLTRVYADDRPPTVYEKEAANMLEQLWIERTNFQRGWVSCCRCEKELQLEVERLKAELRLQKSNAGAAYERIEELNYTLQSAIESENYLSMRLEQLKGRVTSLRKVAYAYDVLQAQLHEESQEAEP